MNTGKTYVHNKKWLQRSLGKVETRNFHIKICWQKLTLCLIELYGPKVLKSQHHFSKMKTLCLINQLCNWLGLLFVWTDAKKHFSDRYLFFIYPERFRVLLLIENFNIHGICIFFYFFKNLTLRPGWVEECFVEVARQQKIDGLIFCKRLSP